MSSMWASSEPEHEEWEGYGLHDDVASLVEHAEREYTLPDELLDIGLRVSSEPCILSTVRPLA